MQLAFSRVLSRSLLIIVVAHLLQSPFADDKAIFGDDHESRAAVERLARDRAAEFGIIACVLAVCCRSDSCLAAAAQLQVDDVLHAGNVGLGRRKCLHTETSSVSCVLHPTAPVPGLRHNPGAHICRSSSEAKVSDMKHKHIPAALDWSHTDAGSSSEAPYLVQQSLHHSILVVQEPKLVHTAGRAEGLP